MSKSSNEEEFFNEGLASYWDVRKCLTAFEQRIKSECIEYLKSKSAELRQKLGAPKESDTPVPYVSPHEEGTEIGAGIWDDHYICVGVYWEKEMEVRAYASRYVGGKKMTSYVCNAIRKPGMIPEDCGNDGWYLTIYEELQSHNKSSLSKALTSALHKWLSIGRKFSDARKKFRG